MEWKYLVAVICPVELLTAASEIVFLLTQNEHDLGGKFFSREVYNIVTGEVTHYLAGMAARDEHIVALEQYVPLMAGTNYTLLTHLGTDAKINDLETWLSEQGLEIR